MKYWIIFVVYTLLFLTACAYKLEPNQTTVEYGTSENGKNKTSKGIKQTFKWNKNNAN